MENSELETIISGSQNNVQELSRILTNFLKNNQNVFTFASLSENNKRVLLWTALFQLLQDKTITQVHALCLGTIRLLSRDKEDLKNLICEQWISVLIEKAGLYSLVEMDNGTMVTLDALNKDIVVESVKCLCNLAFNSDVARMLCVQSCIGEGLIARLRLFKDSAYKEEVMLYDVKLLFILTILQPEFKMNVLYGMEYLINCLKELVEESRSSVFGAGEDMDTGDQHCVINDNKQAIACEILKTQFNLIVHIKMDKVTETDSTMFLKLVPLLATVLSVNASSEQKLMELRSNVANLLTSVPSSYYSELTPILKGGEIAQYVYDGYNMDAIQALIALLQYRLNITTNTTNQYINLSPVLTVFNKSSQGCRVQRKYLRSVVLPPLRDVSLPPEKGNTLRNQLCRLLTTPVTGVRDLVAEFLFILCKRNVGRMVKYTGFGNAAGHLAQKGLLGAVGNNMYSDSSDDSDTEEYLEAQPNIDPVVGCTRPPRVDPFEGMTEEQKEHEVMELVNLLDKLMSDGIVRPARIGPDGKPIPLDHVMELQDK